MESSLNVVIVPSEGVFVCFIVNKIAFIENLIIIIIIL